MPILGWDSGDFGVFAGLSSPRAIGKKRLCFVKQESIEEAGVVFNHAKSLAQNEDFQLAMEGIPGLLPIKKPSRSLARIRLL